MPWPALAVALLAVGGAPGTVSQTAAVGTASPAAADAPTVAAQVDRTQAHVGDVITLTVTAVGPADMPVNLPAALELAPFVELDGRPRSDERKDLGAGKAQHRFEVKIAAYEPGELAVPAVEVTYLRRGGEVGTARTEPVPVKIASLLANEPEPALQPDAPPVRVLERNTPVIYGAIVLAAAALGALIALGLRRRLRARVLQRPVPPPRPAHALALERLDALGPKLGETMDFRPFYFELSEVMREYLGARFGFDALEMTTEEVMTQLERRPARGLVLGEVEGWLSSCDLVKFAKVSPSLDEARGALETAIRLVEATRPRPEPQVGQGGAVPRPEEAARV